jgi:preprotein translocase subunit SecG
MVSKCSNCGRDVRGLADARRAGKQWFCSQSCLLQAESAGTGRTFRRSPRSRSGARGFVRKTIRWTLIVVGLLVVLSIVLAVFGGTDTGKTTKGAARSHPVPLRRAAAIGGGWTLKVLKVTPNANRQVVAVPMSQISEGGIGHANHAPPPGAQDFMILVSLKYTGGGKGDAGNVVHYGLHAMGAHNATYDLVTDSCGNAWPKPNLQDAGVLFSGRSMRGNICFQIAKNDVRSLRMYTGKAADEGILFVSPPEGMKRVWFALR